MGESTPQSNPLTTVDQNENDIINEKENGAILAWTFLILKYTV